MQSKVASVRSALAVLGLIVASAAVAEEPTYQGFLNSVSQSPDCAAQDQSDLVVYTCGSTTWYFTKPGNPAHPSVAQRVTTPTGHGGIHTSDHGWWFAGSSAAAFRVFFAQIQAAPPSPAQSSP